MEGLTLLFRNLLSFFEDTVHQKSFDDQAGFSRRVADESQHRLKGAQGLAGPIDANLTKQAMLNRVPLGTATG